MFSVMYIANGCSAYRFKVWKILVSSVILTLAGVLGAKLMYLIENGSFDGTSFYGAVFLPPLIMYFVAKLLSIPEKKLVDLCAPAECIMLALLKVQCLRSGCCGGRTFHTLSGAEFIFPSQIAELITGLVIMVALLLIMNRRKNVGKIYPIYMIIYGILRFILNLFRKTTPFIWILPAGNFWSIISIAVGIIWCSVLSPKNKPKAQLKRE